MLLDIIHAWISSWVYIYLAIKNSLDLGTRIIFIACFWFYCIVHVYLALLMIRFIYDTVDWFCKYNLWGLMTY